MGVSGSGKSVVGAAFASALHFDFVDGDAFHPTDNVRRMAAGISLTDDDRLPWLNALAARVQEAKRAGTGLVLACSALKRSYRDLLRAEAPELHFIFLRGPQPLLAARLAARHGHFMPPSLLDSQLATLEEPVAEEHAWVCDISETPDRIVAALMARAAE